MKLPIDIAVAISIFNIIKTVEANKINNSKLLIDISSFELLTNVIPRAFGHQKYLS